MRLPSLTLLSAILFASEFGLALAKRRQPGSSRDEDRLTLPLLWLVIGLSIWAAFVLRARYPAARLPFPLYSYLTGLALFLLGVILRWAAIYQLGRYFTVNVAIAEDHKLITSGPYRYVRHPSYSGSFLMFLGYGLCTLNFFSLAALLVPIGLAFLWRIRVEEAALRAAFGDSYRDYCRRTGRLFPRLR